MQRIRFDLRFALFVTSITCVLVWGGADWYDPIRLLICVLLIALASAEYAIIQKTSPYVFAAISSAIGVVVLALIWFPLRAVFFQLIDGPNAEFIHQDFFEDGFQFPLVVAPIGLTICFAPVAAFLGFLCAGIVSSAHRVLGRRNPSELSGG
jgi:hypothetical protein